MYWRKQVIIIICRTQNAPIIYWSNESKFCMICLPNGIFPIEWRLFEPFWFKQPNESKPENDIALMAGEFYNTMPITIFGHIKCEQRECETEKISEYEQAMAANKRQHIKTKRNKSFCPRKFVSTTQTHRYADGPCSWYTRTSYIEAFVWVFLSSGEENCYEISQISVEKQLIVARQTIRKVNWRSESEMMWFRINKSKTEITHKRANATARWENVAMLLTNSVNIIAIENAANNDNKWKDLLNVSEEKGNISVVQMLHDKHHINENVFFRSSIWFGLDWCLSMIFSEFQILKKIRALCFGISIEYSPRLFSHPFWISICFPKIVW